MRRFLFVPLLFLAIELCAQVPADVRITEFMAHNVNSIKDQDGEAKPWLEIWNNARSPTNPTVPVRAVLTGWKLTNGSATWVFPAFELPPEEHVIIWASGKNRSVSTAPLHTDFVLDPAGGTLSLVRADNTVASTFTYTAQEADISYGGDRANPGLTGFYETPTPGATNNFSGTRVAGKLLFSVPSRAFAGSLELSLIPVTPDPAAEIWYTTNRADPTTTPSATNIRYTGPITITTTQMIRARVFTPGLLPGESEAQCYLLLDNSSVNFSAAMPIVAITTFGSNPLSVADNVDVPAYMWVWEPTADAQGSVRSRLSDLPALATRVAVDRRGSSTGGNAKMNLNVEARKSHNDEDKEIVMLGMPDGADWVFHAPYQFDRTLIHNPLAMALSNEMGRYASRTELAEVLIDVNQNALTIGATQSSGDYYGVYNVMEKIRRDKDRVDITRLDMYDNSPVESSGGFIWKIDRLDSGDGGFSAGGQGFAYYYPKEIEIEIPQRDPQETALRNFINGFNTALNGANYTDPVVGYAAWLDVPAAVDHHLHNVWTFNVDALRLSGYMHKDRDLVINGVQTRSKLVYGPQWDFDRALASTDGRDANPVTWRSTSGDLGTDFFNYPWWSRLFNDIDFYQKYIDRWVELRRGVFSQQSVNALIDELNAPLLNPTNPAANGEAVVRDLARWGQTKRGGTVSYPAPPGGTAFSATYPATQAGEIQRMKDWLQVRANFFDSQWVKPVATTPNGGNVAAGATVTLTAAAGSTIYYTTDGSDPRPRGGGAPTSALTYTGPIPIDATTRIKARAYDPSWLTNTSVRIGANNPRLRSAWSGLTNSRFSTDTPASATNLVVTELNYHPLEATAAELGMDPRFVEKDFEWIEVKNVGATTIDLGDARFTSGISFAFNGENAVSLPPGGHVIVAASPQAFAARYGANANVVGPFQGDLDNSGERLVLVNATNETILDFTFDNGWYPSTDGGGLSLVVYEHGAGGPAFSTANNWRPSSAPGGSPGAADPPFVTTLEPTEITATSAQLRAEISPNGSAANVEFVVGTDRHAAAPVSAGNLASVVAHNLANLAPHTLYSYRAEASNAAGLGAGAAMQFTTLNRLPTPVADAMHILQRDPFAIDVLASDTDPDSDPLMIISVTQGEFGTVSTDGNSVLYAPGANFSGSDTFSYAVSDGFGGEAAAVVTLTNSRPVAAGDLLTTNGEPVAFDPRSNDTDADSDPLTVSGITQGAVGVVAVTAEGTISYTPGSQFFGSDTFTYSVTDGAATTTETVVVRSSAAVSLVRASSGQQVPGAPPGTVYAKLGVPSNGSFLGIGQMPGGDRVRAVFASDGTMRLKVGDPAPGVTGAFIKQLQEPSGQAVIATLSGTGINRKNDTVLYLGLNEATIRLGLREGELLPGSSTLKRFLSIDGNGPTVFVRCSLSGSLVDKSNDVALLALPPDSGVRLLAREGDIVLGRPITLLGTLLGSRGTLAEGRWRAGDDSIGVRLSFAGNTHALYTIPANATSPAEWTEWGKTGDVYAGQGTAASFGLPGFAPDGASFLTQLALGSGGGVVKTNDTLILRATAAGVDLLAAEGASVPGGTGTTLPGLTFKKFGDPISGANASTAFAATLAGAGVGANNRAGLWFAAAENLAMIARAGDLAPGGGRWEKFESLILPNGVGHGPIFTAKLAVKSSEGVTPTTNRGMWGIDSEGTLRLLLRTGQVVSVNGTARIVSKFDALTPPSGSLGAAHGIDDQGAINVLVTFPDRTQAIIGIALP